MRRRLSDSVSSFSHYLENSREHFIRIWKTLNFVQRVSAIWRFSNYVTLLFSVLKILRTMPACYLWCTTGLPFSGRVVCFAVQWCQYHDQFIKLAKLKASFLELFSLCKSEDKLQTSSMLRHGSIYWQRPPHEVNAYTLWRQCCFNVINHPSVLTKVVTVL